MCFHVDGESEVLPGREGQAGKRRSLLHRSPYCAVVKPPPFKFISALSVACVAAVCVTSSLLALLFSYQLRIECMLLCEETASVLEMLKPKVKFMEEACHCK